MNHPIRLLGALLVCAVVYGGACGGAPTAGGGQGESAGSSVDVCTLFSKADAAAALGEPAGSPSPRSTPTSSGCTYPNAGGGALLNVDVSRWPDAAAAASKFADFGKVGDPVSGLGDQALLSPSSILVQKGPAILQVALVGVVKQPDQPGAVKALALKILPRI